MGLGVQTIFELAGGVPCPGSKKEGQTKRLPFVSCAMFAKATFTRHGSSLPRDPVPELVQEEAQYDEDYEESSCDGANAG